MNQYGTVTEQRDLFIFALYFNFWHATCTTTVIAKMSIKNNHKIFIDCC